MLLFCVGPTHKAKSEAEQKILMEKRDAMGAWKKFTLWLKWGFRWKYPDGLGEEPDITRKEF
jgi:hypothetical protein